MSGRRRDGTVSEARKAQARKHASRVWTCSACGKPCRGNGGKTSHQRACQPFNEQMVAAWTAKLTELPKGDAARPYVERHLAESQAALDAILARKAKP